MNIENFIKQNKKINIKLHHRKKNPGIYFVCNSVGEIVYIGKSEYIDTRIASHKRNKQFNDCFFYYFDCKEKLLETENKLINEIRPEFNLNGFKKADKLRQTLFKKEQARLLEIQLENEINIKQKSYTPMKLNIEKINRELKRLGWSKPRLAKELGLTRQGVYYYLSSGATIWKAERLGDALGVDPKDLLI